VFIRVVKLSLLAIMTTISFTPACTAVRSPQADEPLVLTGIDVLQRDRFQALAGRNIGLITNQTGVDRSGTSDIQLLHDAANVTALA